jgi:hypothetical protein
MTYLARNTVKGPSQTVTPFNSILHISGWMPYTDFKKLHSKMLLSKFFAQLTNFLSSIREKCNHAHNVFKCYDIIVLLQKLTICSSLTST